jgi:hypothetical protein
MIPLMSSQVMRWLSRPSTALTLAALEIAVLGTVNLLDFPLSVPYLHRLTGHAYLDMCGFCTSDMVQSEITALGEKGRLLQALLLSTIDMLIPLLSCIFGISALAALTTTPRERGSPVKWLLALPVLALLLDFTENGTIVALLLRYPEPGGNLAALEGLMSGLKFATYGLVVLMIVVLLVAQALRSRRPLQTQ